MSEFPEEGTKYRGFTIKKDGESFAVIRADIEVARCNTAWSCHVWIDEYLSP